jgi:flagellar basal-body rod protein FlgC
VYRARHPVFAVQPFEDADGAVAAGVRMAGVVENRSAPAVRYDPGNPLADAQGRIYSASVSPVEEMADMISASRSYQSNVAVIETARELVLRTLAMGR